MIILIGLGNPGSRYIHNRHNMGFQVLDAFSQKESSVFNDKKLFSAFIAPVGKDLLLAKPQTYMNDSGISAKAIDRNYDAVFVIVYDDIDIPLGEVKCSYGRGAGGHNGVQSIIDHLGTKDFFRVRVGVRPVHEELKPKILPPNGFQEFLLSNFAPFEKELFEQGIQKAISIIEMLKTKTFEEIMNTVN